MTNEQAIEIITLMYDMAKKSVSTNTSNADALEMAIKALEQESRDCKTCIHSNKGKCAGTEECHECMWESKYEQTDGDLISRQAVIDIVEFECGEWKGLAKTIVKAIEQLPSAEKTAEWILKDGIYGVAYCSKCDYELHTNDTNYCPNCGRRMKGVD